MSAGLLKFGPYALAASEVFYATRLTVGIVNLKPAADLFRAAMRIAPEVEREFGGSAITL
ncbi:hypothetical protein HK405_015966, partial [Cladochytrium tenue]